MLEVVQQAVGVCGDPHHPLGQGLAEHWEVAALAAPVDDLLVGDDGAQPRRPVDHRLGAVGQPVVVDHPPARDVVQIRPRDTSGRLAGARLQFGDQFLDRTGLVQRRVVPGVEDPQEDPLRPAVELRVGGGDAAAGVVAEAQPAQLPQEDVDVLVRGRAGVLTGLDRALLGGQPERVEAHRVQYVVTAHAPVPRVGVGADVAQRVPDVQTRPGRVGKHVQDVGVGAERDPVEPVRQRPGRVRCGEGAVGLPAILPGRLDAVGHSARVPVRRYVLFFVHRC